MNSIPEKKRRASPAASKRPQKRKRTLFLAGEELSSPPVQELGQNLLKRKNLTEKKRDGVIRGAARAKHGEKKRSVN